MKDNSEIFTDIDKIIDKINKYRQEPIFSDALTKRRDNIVPVTLTENEILEIFINLIAYSQNANSDLVEKIISGGIFKEMFSNFDINKVAEMNPCDLADRYWSKISGIRQQAKLFHIVSLARKIKRIGFFSTIMMKTEIPRQITSEDDITRFWDGFAKLQATLADNKVPFFQSTTSLLHFLLETGYDCIKPDLVVMKVSKKLGIVETDKRDHNLIKTVKTIQQYSLARKIRPNIIDFYFLIEEGQLGSKKYVKPDFYITGGTISNESFNLKKDVEAVIKGTVTSQGVDGGNEEICEILISKVSSDKLPHEYRKKKTIHITIGDDLYEAGVHETQRGAVWISSVLYKNKPRREKVKLKDALSEIGIKKGRPIIIKTNKDGTFLLQA